MIITYPTHQEDRGRYDSNKNAINNEVIVTDSKGSAAIELKEIGQTTEVTLTLKNIGNTATTYTLDKSYLMTEKADPQSKIVKSALLKVVVYP